MQCSISPSPFLFTILPQAKLSSTRKPPKTQTHENENINNARKAGLLSHKVKSITSTSNPFVKHCLKLRQNSSYRHSHGSALVVGTTLTREIYRFQELGDRAGEIDCLLLLDNAEISDDLSNLNAHIVSVSSMVMKKLSGVQSIESIEAIALMKIPRSFIILQDSDIGVDFSRWFPYLQRILVLDGIQDPGNLGTLLRSATAFNWDGVFLLPGCCDPFNDKALRASRGACFQLPLVSGSWMHLETLQNKNQMKMLAGHPNSDQQSVCLLSQTLIESLAHVPLCLILGSEGSGLSEESRRACELVSIPMAGEFESLNVSVAGGIFLYMLQSKRTS